MLHDFRKHCPIDERIALQFLFARKFDLDRALTLYDQYMTKVDLYGFQDVQFVEILPELKTGKLVIPGTRDLKNAGLLIFYAGRHEPDVFPPVATLALSYYLTTHILLKDPLNQRHGVTVLVDFTNVSWSNIDQEFVKMFVDFFQNGLPVRLKNILLYRPPIWIQWTIRMLSLFIKEKLRRRIILTYTLDDYIDPADLPQDIHSGQLIYDHELMVKRLCENAKQAGQDVELAFDKEEMLSLSRLDPTRLRLPVRLNHAVTIDSMAALEAFYGKIPDLTLTLKDNDPVDRVTLDIIRARLSRLEKNGSIDAGPKQASLMETRNSRTDPATGQVVMIPAWPLAANELKSRIKALIKKEMQNSAQETNYPDELFYFSGERRGNVASRASIVTDVADVMTSGNKRTVQDSEYLKKLLKERFSDISNPPATEDKRQRHMASSG